MKNRPQKLLIIVPTIFFHSPAQPTAHSPKLIFHVINMSQDSSVSLSVVWAMSCVTSLLSLLKINKQYILLNPMDLHNSN